MKWGILAEVTKFAGFYRIIYKSIFIEVLSIGDLISSKFWSLAGILILLALANDSIEPTA